MLIKHAKGVKDIAKHKLRKYKQIDANDAMMSKPVSWSKGEPFNEIADWIKYSRRTQWYAGKTAFSVILSCDIQTKTNANPITTLKKWKYQKANKTILQLNYFVLIIIIINHREKKRFRYYVSSEGCLYVSMYVDMYPIVKQKFWIEGSTIIVMGS